MTATQFYELSCDFAGCDQRLAGSGEPGETVLLHDMRTYAAEQGWSARIVRGPDRGRVEDLCPKHTVEAATP